MSPHDNRPIAEGFTLPSLVTQLRESRETSARLHGGSTHYTEELGIFRSFIEEKNLVCAEPPSELVCTPTAEGNEHQVWYRKDSATFLKATWPNHFGMKVVHRNDEEPQASPIDYLERWQLHNQVFGDSIEFLGALDTSDGLRLLIEQPAVEGSVATIEQIDRFFRQSGWQPFSINGNLAYCDVDERLVISDTHRGNIILMDDGLLAPIDLRIQPLTPALFDIVQQLI